MKLQLNYCCILGPSKVLSLKIKLFAISLPCLNNLLKKSMLTIVQGTESTSTLATLETPSKEKYKIY